MATAYAQMSRSISFAPPELPVYEQPVLPGDGYILDARLLGLCRRRRLLLGAGRLGHGSRTWSAMDAGLLGMGRQRICLLQRLLGPAGRFLWWRQLWIWIYGDGYQGGRWQNGQFFYNRSVSNVNVTNIHNVYNTTVINSTTINRVSYNGGSGGISARPTAQEETVAHEEHIPPVAAQTQREQAARPTRSSGLP